MLKVKCATFEGIEAKSVDVELSVTKGLPSFNIVGMASLAISESKERVKSALLTNNFSFPPKRITISLSPADLKKSGSHFDLAIALCIALESQKCVHSLDDFYIFSELGLDGKTKESSTLFALILSLANQNKIERAIVPKEAIAKLSKIPNVRFYAMQSLQEAIDFFLGNTQIEQATFSDIQAEKITIANKNYFYNAHYNEDFSDVKGQLLAKRAALIAAAGMHNILFEGSPGCGKSMIAKRLRYILPPLSRTELLNIAKQQTLNAEEVTFTAQRPFQAPHHSSTQASIFGGGSAQAKIGEVALANHGILFFDELPHFAKNVLEALREPLEDKKIRISRVNSKIVYPADFMFVAAMNPCPCGNLLHKELSCRCSDIEIQRYKNRLSEPFLDRIDLYVTMQNSNLQDRSTDSSQTMHQKVIDLFTIQKNRGQNSLNGQLSDKDIDKYCIISSESEDLLAQATQRFSLSFRSIKKILKVARTIADLDASENIEKKHLLEALSFRKR